MKKIAIISFLLLISTSLASAQSCDPPGEAVGTTHYPVQSSGSSTNRIGLDALDGLHFTWMTGTTSSDRNIRYNFRDENGQWVYEGGTPVSELNGAGYPSLALRADNTAAITFDPDYAAGLPVTDFFFV